MILQPGATLDHYRIVDKLGEGGMGVVWRAVDTTLDREVAIKVLPGDSATDGERLARFEREAKLLASLNHPNIAAIHGLHRSGDTHFLAMELVAGEDLAARVDAGPLPLDETLKIARQLARALAAAHHAGVIHRDLKPANIRITAGNEVKVLDFGLAKALAPVGASSGGAPGPSGAAASGEAGAGGAAGGSPEDPAQSPTITSLGTVAGMILGTAAYMAPEQARGRPVDHRADIWAFGVVVYEMLTGRRLFSGETVSDTMAQVLTKNPDLDAVPARARRLLRACLAREPEDRLRDIGDAMLLVDEEDAADPVAAASRAEGTAARRIGAAGWILAAASLLAGLLVGAIALSSGPAAAPPTSLRFFEHPPAGGRFIGAPVPSPDGRHLAMVVQERGARRRIWVRSLEDDTARPLEATEDARWVRWSPDSEELVYHALFSLRRVRRDGSQERIVVSSTISDATLWGPDGYIYVATVAAGLQRVSADGGELEPVVPAEGFAFRSVDYVTGGPHLLVHQFGGSNGIYTLAPDGSERRSLVPGVNSPVRFLPPDHILYVHDRVLTAQQVDPQAMTLVGEPQSVASDVAPVDFEASAAGIISYAPGSSRLSELTYFDRGGTHTGTAGPPAEYRELKLSPDGRQLIYVAADPITGNNDLWLQDLDGAAPNRFSTGPDTDHLVAFSPDGSEVAWESHTSTDLVVMRRPTDMSAPAELLRVWNRGGGPHDWHPGGDYVLYGSDDGPTQTNLWAVPLDGGEPQPLVDSEFREDQGRFSPDGEWVAYTSDASGRDEIYIQRIDGIRRVGGPLRVSTGGGVKAQWRADGNELFYLQGTMLMAVDMDLSGERPPGTPREMFDVGPRVQYQDYVVSPDGQSFLVIVETDDSPPAAATVIMNWRPRTR